MRWLFATMMYVTRVISPSDIDKILSVVMPTTSNVVDIDAMRSDVYRMLLELQSDICHTHERVARAWMDGPSGLSFLADQQLVR
jgi:hypothetical protein